MNSDSALSGWCPHLYVVGDTQCRLCLMSLDRGEVLTDQTDDQGVDWGGMDAPDGRTNWEESTAAVAAELPRPIYPEYPPLGEAPISINFKITGEPMITVRGSDAHQITTLLNDLSNGGVWANIAAAQADLRTQGGLGAGLGPVSPVGPPAPPQGPAGPAPWQTPQTPPPFGANVSVPSAPGYVGPPGGPTSFPGQQSYPSAPPQQGWGGGNGGGNNRAEPKPQPPGWYRLNARSGPGFDAWKELREQHKDNLKGKVQWGGKSDYWIEPSLAGWLAQMGFAVTP